MLALGIVQLESPWHSPNPFTERLPALIYLTSFCTGGRCVPEPKARSSRWNLQPLWRLVPDVLPFGGLIKQTVGSAKPAIENLRFHQEAPFFLFITTTFR